MMRYKLVFWTACCWFWCISCGAAFGQTDEELFEDEFALVDVEAKLVGYNTGMEELKQNLQTATREKLLEIQKEMERIDVKWNVYNQSKQEVITGSDSLLQLVADYQMYKQETLDSLNARKHYFESMDGFDEAELFIASQDTAYSTFQMRALELSMAKKLAPMLEKLKVKEQLLFAEVQAHYEKAKMANTEFPELQKRYTAIEDKYIELTNMSAKIQAMEYKPLIQRIKDYLFGLAAVAMILMFVNMVMAKIKGLKQARENAKKMKEMLNKSGNGDYPTI